MIDKYIFFKKNKDERFIIGPKGFNNSENHPLSNLIVWNLYNDENQTYLISSNKVLLSYFTGSEELIAFLKAKDVTFKNIKIDFNNMPIKGEGGIVFNLYTGDSMCLLFSLEKEGKTLIQHRFYCDEGWNYSTQFNTTIRTMFNESYKLVSEVSVDSNENPPAWMNGILEEQQRGDLKNNLKWFMVAFIVIIIIILNILTSVR